MKVERRRMRLHINKHLLFLLLLAFSMTYPQAIAQENMDTLCVYLPEGTTAGPNPDPWLSEGWVLNLTGDSWTFHVQVIQMHDTYISYKTHLVVALNDAAYNNLIALTVNGTTLPKASFRNGTPTPFNKWTWPNDVYPTWFNDTYINLETIYPEEHVDLMVSATFSDTANVRIHFDAYGKTIPCTITPEPDEIMWSPSSHDSTVVAAPKNPVATFNLAPKPAILNEPVIFDASDSYDPDGWIVDYEWDFGDSNSAATADPIVTHTYLAIGNYTVALTVTDNDMNTAITSAMTSVIEYPTAHFTYSPKSHL